MLCFLCSFSCPCSTYCYCAPGRLVRVVSTPDVIADNKSRTRKTYRRSKSQPMLQTFENITQFRRFRSLREKRDEKVIENGIRMSPISIASSTEKRWSQKRAIRSRAEQRLESMLSSSSGSIPHMEAELPPLNLKEAAENVSTGISTNSSSELVIDDSKSSINMEMHMPGSIEHHAFPNDDPLEKSIDEEIERLKELAKNLNITDIEKLNLRTDMQESDIPNGWHNPINYSFELEQYMQKENLNPFADPFEEDDRRSRIEMWVESTSPGVPDSDNEPENFVLSDGVQEDTPYLPNSSAQQVFVPQFEVRVDECSENSLSSPPPADKKVSKPAIEPSVKPIELLENCKESRIERMDSLQTEEFASETTSFISSELDKVSLVKEKFTTNLDKALEGNEQVINIDEIERFWDYRYTSAEEPAGEENQKEQEEREQRPTKVEDVTKPSALQTATLSPEDYRKHRSPTPTVERVVLYYTSDRRPSFTPSPSPSVLTLSPGYSERSPVEQVSQQPEEQNFLFPVIQNPPSSILIVVDENESDIDFDLPGTPHTCLTSDGLDNDEQSEDDLSKMQDYVRNKKLHSRSHRSKSSSSESSIIIGVTNDLTPTLRSSYFQLDQYSASDSEEGHVVDLDGIEFSLNPASRADNDRPQMVSRATSTNDLIFEEENTKTTLAKTENRQLQQTETSISGFPLEYKSKYSAKKAVNVPKSERRSQTSKRYINWRSEKLFRLSSNVSTSAETEKKNMLSPPIIVESKVDDDDISSADQEVELRMFDGRVLGNIKSSSTEDLLELDTRPNLAGRKSVSFNEKVNEEIASSDTRRKSAPPTSPVSLTVTTRPILKKEDKHRETLHKLMCHAAERLYKDLRMLIEERDRSVHAIDLVPNELGDLSPHTGSYQSQYRDKLLENKEALDRRISEVWKKLKELPLDNPKSNFVYSVNDSSLLTLNARRRILQRRISFQQPSVTDGVRRSDYLEMASDYATRLAQMRERMIRRDSEVKKEDDRSVEEILQRVSRALYG